MVSGAANNLSLATIEFTHVNKVDDQYGSEFHDENYSNKVFRHLENLFIHGIIFIHLRFVFIVQASLLVVQ